MRRPIFIGVAVVIAALITGIATQAEFDAQRQSEPPHAERLMAVTIGHTPDELMAAGAAVDQALQEMERVRIEAENAERQRLADLAAEEARAADLRQSIPRAPTVSPQPGGDCSGFPTWFPHYIIWRESNCTRGINTGNGYYGAYQVAGFHWNGGICSGLTWTVPAQEDECAWRLSSGGTNFRPWGA